jgi:[ribosomal protein S18]-alanine N-acetyltransferase
MKAAISIRPAIAEDVEVVLALERAVPEAPHWARAAYETMARQAGEPSGMRRRLLVVEIDGALVGFVVGKVVAEAQSSELESVAVLPSARHMGVGRAMCEAMIAWCRQQGVTSMELEVRSASLAARRLYERLGFVIEGFRKGYYREPEDDAVLMRLNFECCG